MESFFAFLYGLGLFVWIVIGTAHTSREYKRDMASIYPGDMPLADAMIRLMTLLILGIVWPAVFFIAAVWKVAQLLPIGGPRERR